MTPTKSEAAHRTAGLVYCLWLLGILFGITAVIGVIINHSNLSKVRGTHAYSHFIWQIGSFWVVFAGTVLAIIFWPLAISKILMFGCFTVWLTTGLFGSWSLSKSRRIRFFDRRHRSSGQSSHSTSASAST